MPFKSIEVFIFPQHVISTDDTTDEDHLLGRIIGSLGFPVEGGFTTAIPKEPNYRE
jgi:hypothetical protein